MGRLGKIGIYIKKFFVKQKYTSSSRNRNIWLFGEWFGKRCCDNSLYLANYVAEHYPDVQCVWAAEEGADLALLNKKVKNVFFNTKEALDVYQQAGVVFMNQGFVDFSKEGYNFFKGAITINLWHGVAWKKIGHDAAKTNGLLHRINIHVVDALEKTDYYVSTSEEYSKVLKSALHAKESEIIMSGYPRNSLFFSHEGIVASQKKTTGIIETITRKRVVGTPKIITYMPTFRDKTAIQHSLDELKANSEFIEWLEKNNIYIIQKMHFISKSRNEQEVGNNCFRILTLEDISAQELMASSDMLITDYSSCFFDFLVLDRPIIHFIYDYEYYKNKDRGVYYEYQDVICGDAVWNIEELARSIMDNLENPDKQKELREIRRNTFMSSESSETCNTICQFILRQL